MAFFEIDFLYMDADKSGDAIPLRYSSGILTDIHVVDGGFQETGEDVIRHIENYYHNPSVIDRVIVTHPDGDHAGGLRSVLDHFDVAELWMLRPWIYADEIIHRFTKFKSVENLRQRLKELYPNIHKLEEIAFRKDIPIYEPFQGQQIGAFVVLAPSKPRYLDLVVESERTPEAARQEVRSVAKTILGAVAEKAKEVWSAVWGEERFSDEETSSENEMSVVQYAVLCEESILLTGDAGRSALTEAADYAEEIGIILPGVDRFQVPHHGSRRNVSTEVLDRWLGPRLKQRVNEGEERFTSVICATEKDKDHPRKAVLRAMIHRGGKVLSTEKGTICTHRNGPNRGWVAARPLAYPEEQEA